MEIVKPAKIIVVYGPTASGKSAVAIKLAQKFGGEIISADSRQVYQGLDIGAGKVARDTKNNNQPVRPGSSVIGHQKNTKGAFYSEGIRHHLIDVAKPMEDYNVSHFKKDAAKIIENILNPPTGEGKIPIICGGTNFWIDAVVYDSQIPEVAPDEKLRKELEEKSPEELFAQLEKLDPERAENIDAKNKVRLIRAIEICNTLGKVPVIQNTKYEIRNTKYEFLQIGIQTERVDLNAKIKKRLAERFNEGMIQEVENLQRAGVSPAWLEKIGLEYRWISRFLQQKISEKELKEKLYFDIIHFAKRQMTWLKKNPDIIWLKDYPTIEKEVQKFL